ncbi:MAG: SH3 domain-containing protein [Anaerolineae bacterium]|jgi:hypothetical protein|nr:SH3 domain-containing protein [Anaerolineae bacterium]
MGNDFDNDDLSWLRRPNDQDDDSNQDEQPDLDWLIGDQGNAPKQRDEKRLGVTGELPWLRDRDSDDQGVTSEEDLNFDWMSDPTSEPKQGEQRRLGVTGQLNWLQDPTEATEEAPQVNARKSAIEEQIEAAERAAGVNRNIETPNFDDEETSALPSWLQGAEADPEDDLTLDDAPEFNFEDLVSENPDWLPTPTATNTPVESFNFDDLDVAETPDWLRVDRASTDDDDFFNDLFGDQADEVDLFAGQSSGTGLTGLLNADDVLDESDEAALAPSGTGLTGLLNPDASTELDSDFDLFKDFGDPASEDEEPSFDDFDWSFSEDQLETPSPVQPVRSSSSMDELDDLGWLESLEAAPVTASSSKTPPKADSIDVDSFLASLGTGSGNEIIPQVDFDDLANTIDFEDLFNDDFDQLQSPQEETPLPLAPDWLANVSVGEVSASAIVRKQQDRPLEDLSDRLLALREEGLNLNPTETVENDLALANLIPDLTDALPPAPIQPGTLSITNQLKLTPEQIKNAQLLAGIASLAGDAIGVEALRESVAKPRPRLRLQLKIGRLLIAVVVLIAVILPFFGIGQIGELPPGLFPTNSPEQRVFDQIDRLQPGQLVLFAAEYGATSAGDLNTVSDVLLNHIVLRGARPVIVSTNPIGVLLASERVTRITGLTPNTDYYIGGYIAGESIGLRDFSENLRQLTSNDLQGQSTGLALNSLDDFALIVVVAERLESARNWAEQIAPITNVPITMGISYSASPLIMPYLNAGIDGVIIGYEDAFTYSVLLEGLEGVDRPTEEATASETPTVETPILATPIVETPTLATPIAETPTATPIPTLASPTAQPTTIATGESIATATVDAIIIIATEEVTPTLTPENTVIPPSPTPIPPTPTDAATETFARVNASQAVNVREGAGLGFRPVGSVQPGERVLVLEANSDQTWYRVRLANDLEGWILGTLLDFEDDSTNWDDEGQTVYISFIRQSPPTSTPAPIASAPELIPYREERWYAMTLGISVIVLIIAVVNIFNLIRRGR